MGLSLYVILVFFPCRFYYPSFVLCVWYCNYYLSCGSPPTSGFFHYSLCLLTSIGVSFFRGSSMILLKVFFCAFDLWQSPSPIRITHWFDLFKASQTLLYFVPKFFDKIKYNQIKQKQQGWTRYSNKRKRGLRTAT